jgi:hypothetical protein
MYVGQPLAEDLRRFLCSQGFRLWTRINTSEWFGDEIYCRKDLASPWKVLVNAVEEAVYRIGPIRRLLKAILPGR